MPLDTAANWRRARNGHNPNSARRIIIARGLRARVCALRACELVQFLQSQQDIARLGPVRWAKNARELQLVDDAGRPPVADAHPALEQRRGSELILDAYLSALTEQRISRPGPRPLTPGSFFPIFSRFPERLHLSAATPSRRPE